MERILRGSVIYIDANGDRCGEEGVYNHEKLGGMSMNSLKIEKRAINSLRNDRNRRKALR